MLVATGILATDCRSDIVNLAFPAILGWYLVEPQTRLPWFSCFGAIPYSVGHFAPHLFDTSHFAQDVLSAQALPAVDVGLGELIVVVEFTAAVSTLTARETIHPC